MKHKSYIAPKVETCRSVQTQASLQDAEMFFIVLVGPVLCMGVHELHDKLRSTSAFRLDFEHLGDGVLPAASFDLGLIFREARHILGQLQQVTLKSLLDALEVQIFDHINSLRSTRADCLVHRKVVLPDGSLTGDHVEGLGPSQGVQLRGVVP